MNLPHTFVANTLAKAEQVNENFEAVVNEITAQGVELLANIQTVNANASSQIATLRSDVDSAIDDVEDEIDSLSSDITDLSGKSYAPNYSRGISVSIPYTAPSNGWMYLTVDGYDWEHPAYVNNKQVGVSCGYSGGKAVRNGVMFMVSTGDVVSGYISTAIFYPLREA